MALYQLLLVAVVATAASAACTGNKAGLHCGWDNDAFAKEHFGHNCSMLAAAGKCVDDTGGGAGIQCAGLTGTDKTTCTSVAGCQWNAPMCEPKATVSTGAAFICQKTCNVDYIKAGGDTCQAKNYDNAVKAITNNAAATCETAISVANATGNITSNAVAAITKRLCRAKYFPTTPTCPATITDSTVATGVDICTTDADAYTASVVGGDCSAIARMGNCGMYGGLFAFTCRKSCRAVYASSGGKCSGVQDFIATGKGLGWKTNTADGNVIGVNATKGCEQMRQSYESLRTSTTQFSGLKYLCDKTFSETWGVMASQGKCAIQGNAETPATLTGSMKLTAKARAKSLGDAAVFNADGPMSQWCSGELARAHACDATFVSAQFSNNGDCILTKAVAGDLTYVRNGGKSGALAATAIFGDRTGCNYTSYTAIFGNYPNPADVNAVWRTANINASKCGAVPAKGEVSVAGGNVTTKRLYTTCMGMNAGRAYKAPACDKNSPVAVAAVAAAAAAAKKTQKLAAASKPAAAVSAIVLAATAVAALL